MEKIKFFNRIITKTEHPKLFIYEKEDNVLFHNDISQERDFVNINIFSYTSAKFVHVGKHFRMLFKSIYLLRPLYIHNKTKKSIYILVSQ